MPDLLSDLRRHHRVGFDTSIFIYHFEGATPLAGLASTALQALVSGHIEGITSVLTLMELCTRPLKLGRPDLANTYEVTIHNWPNLVTVGIDRILARGGAELRARHGLQSVDAAQIAAGLMSRATAFLTNDRRLRRITELQILLLDDYLAT